MKFKGPVFPSYLQPAVSKTVRQWIPHSRVKQQKRNLRNACRSILNSSLPEDVRAKARVRASVADEPDPEFGFLHLLFVAIDASNQTGESFATAMNYFMDTYDNLKEDARVEAAKNPAN